MRRLGYWIERLDDERFCLPHEFVGAWTAEFRLRVADYLDHGSLFRSYRGFSWCRFRCGSDARLLGSRELTDGRWVWPEGLSHYVREHGVVLPEEFIERVGESRPMDLSISTAEPNDEWWIDWCARRRSMTVLARQRELAADARRQAAARFDQLIVERESAKGLSDLACAWANCSSRALAGMRVCARHDLGDVETTTDFSPSPPRLEALVASLNRETTR